MEFEELKPEWQKDNNHIIFNCPTCAAEKKCIIVIPTRVTEHEKNPWNWNGQVDYGKVTLTPSIWHHCESNPHFFITDGKIQMV